MVEKDPKSDYQDQEYEKQIEKIKTRYQEEVDKAKKSATLSSEEIEQLISNAAKKRNKDIEKAKKAAQIRKLERIAHQKNIEINQEEKTQDLDGDNLGSMFGEDDDPFSDIESGSGLLGKGWNQSADRGSTWNKSRKREKKGIRQNRDSRRKKKEKSNAVKTPSYPDKQYDEKPTQGRHNKEVIENSSEEKASSEEKTDNAETLETNGKTNIASQSTSSTDSLKSDHKKNEDSVDSEQKQKNQSKQDETNSTETEQDKKDKSGYSKENDNSKDPSPEPTRNKEPDKDTEDEESTSNQEQEKEKAHDEQSNIKEENKGLEEEKVSFTNKESSNQEEAQNEQKKNKDQNRIGGLPKIPKGGIESSKSQILGNTQSLSKVPTSDTRNITATIGNVNNTTNSLPRTNRCSSPSVHIISMSTARERKSSILDKINGQNAPINAKPIVNGNGQKDSLSNKEDPEKQETYSSKLNDQDYGLDEENSGESPYFIQSIKNRRKKKKRPKKEKWKEEETAITASKAEMLMKRFKGNDTPENATINLDQETQKRIAEIRKSDDMSNFEKHNSIRKEKERAFTYMYFERKRKKRMKNPEPGWYEAIARYKKYEKNYDNYYDDTPTDDADQIKKSGPSFSANSTQIITFAAVVLGGILLVLFSMR